MSRFKVGQTVYMDRGEKMKTLVVARVHKNPMIPVRQYTFEAPNDGFACGEQSIRATIDGADLRLRDCFVDDHEVEVPVRINTITSAKRHPIFMDRVESGFEVGKLFSDCDICFRPDLKFVTWIKNHANGRLIIDVGSGQGHLVTMLKRVGAKAMGIEPNIDHEVWIKWRMQNDLSGEIDVNEVLTRRIEDCKNIIDGLGKDNVLLIFARPSSGDYVKNGIRNMPYGMEALYISKPTDLINYDDLGRFKKNATPLVHEGVSEDDEVVYSIKR